MDSGSFYRGGSSFMTPLSGSPGYTTSTPNTSRSHIVDPCASEAYSSDSSVGQKLDHLLYLFHEEKKQASELKEIVSTLQGQVEEMKKRQKVELEAEKDKVKSQKQGYKLPPDISLAVKHLHEHSPSALKFDGEQVYTAKKNQDVKEYLMECIGDKFKDSASPRRIRKAVHRYYESRRRLFNDDQPGRREQAEAVKDKCKKKNYQKRFYNSRKTVLKKTRESEMWSEIDYKYMTEESEGEEDTIKQHKLPWRSRKLDKIVRRLDKRLAKKSRGGSFKPKKRVLSSVSVAEAPEGAAAWAVCYGRVVTPPAEDSVSMEHDTSEEL